VSVNGSSAVVHVEQEFVEMGAALTHDGTCFEEQVHQHRLAAADVAIDVKTLERLFAFLAVAEQPAERRRFPRQAMLNDAGLEP